MSIAATVAALMDQYDEDKSGTLHSDDTRPFYDKLAADRPDLGLTAEGYQEWFNAIDGNSDLSGTISPEDLTAYLEKINYGQ